MTSLPTILTAIRTHAQQMPAKPAVHLTTQKGEQTLNWEDLYKEVGRYAAYYREMGVEAGQVVLLMLPHCMELYPAFLGAMQAGATPAILPFPTPKQHPDAFWSSHKKLFARIEPAFILGYEDIRERLAQALPDGTRTAELESLQLPADPIYPAEDSDDAIALLQHSSGTTGLKKGVMLSYGQIARQVSSYGASLDVTQEDIVASWLPLYHDMGLISSFLMPISAGLTIISLDPFDWVTQPLTLLKEIEKHRASLCWMPNFAFSHMRQHFELLGPIEVDLSSLRAIISCSEPVRAETLERFSETFAASKLAATAPQACYAMAETVFAVAQSDLSKPARVVYVKRGAVEAHKGQIIVTNKDDPDALNFVSNGPTIDGLKVRIAMEEGLFPIEAGADVSGVGEIQISGDFLFSGYYKNPEQTAEAFTEDGWYRTGDLGFCEGGELFICGREKELMIIHGKNYYAGDIEQLVSAVPGVKSGRAVAFHIVDARTDSEECIVMAETTETDATALRDLKRLIKTEVYDGLALMVKTVELVGVGTLAKTTSGKMSRADNKAIWKKNKS